MPITLTKAADRAPRPQSQTVGDTPQLEMALLRRSLSGLTAQVERCGRCERHLLTGERVFEYGAGEVRCSICSGRERREPADSHRVHTSAFGSSMRIVDNRAA